MLTLFQVDHGTDSPPKLLLQHVLDKGQRIAVMLCLGVQAAVVDHKPALATFLVTTKHAEAHSE